MEPRASKAHSGAAWCVPRSRSRVDNRTDRSSQGRLGLSSLIALAVEHDTLRDRRSVRRFGAVYPLMVCVGDCIPGYSSNARLQSQLAVTAADTAVARRHGVVGCSLHTDHGAQNCSKHLTGTFARLKLIGSIGKVGSAGDHAAMDSFFSLLQTNVLNPQAWTSREELRLAIVTRIESICHRRRRQEILGRLAPVDCESVMAPTANQAA